MPFQDKTIFNIRSRKLVLSDVDSHAVNNDDYHCTPDDPKNKNLTQPNKDQTAVQQKI